MSEQRMQVQALHGVIIFLGSSSRNEPHHWAGTPGGTMMALVTMDGTQRMPGDTRARSVMSYYSEKTSGT